MEAQLQGDGLLLPPDATRPPLAPGFLLHLLPSEVPSTPLTSSEAHRGVTGKVFSPLLFESRLELTTRVNYPTVPLFRGLTSSLLV